MFGPKRNPRPATRWQVGCVGALFFSFGAFLLWGLAYGERDPGAPKIMLFAAFAFLLFLAAFGGALLLRAVFWDGDERR
jgi:hypothetical protein